jgi:hypothetical protein
MRSATDCWKCSFASGQWREAGSRPGTDRAKAHCANVLDTRAEKITPVQRESRREIALVGLLLNVGIRVALQGGRYRRTHTHVVRGCRLKRLETKKAGEASLWIAPVNRATCNKTTDKPSCIKTFQSAPAKIALPENELDANEGLMLLERCT